jgi:hypothetical protein
VQGSILRLNIDESVKNVQVIIETKWDEEVVIKSSLPHSLHSTIKVESNSKDISVSIGKEMQDIAQGFVLHICIPEYFDLSIKGPAMQLKLQNKLMGNFLLVIPDGSVSIDKVKGSQIGIFAGEATLDIKKVLEGNISVQCGNLTGKMINGEEVSIASSDSIAVGAIYGSNTVIQAGGKVDLGVFRGQLQCESNKDASIRGIDGAISVQSHEGDIHLHVNFLTKLSSKADEIHPEICSGSSISQAQHTEASVAHGTNSAFAKNGNIYCQLDHEVKLNVFCEGNKASPNSVAVESTVFAKEFSSDSSIMGHFIGNSQSSTRSKFGHIGGVGKINLPAAERQSFYRAGSATGSGNFSETMEWAIPSAAAAKDNEDFAKDMPTLLAVAPSGNITLKSMSWMDVIKAKHGMA